MVDSPEAFTKSIAPHFEMSKVILQKEELAALVLSEMRTYGGCDSVASVVILETTDPRAAANWEIGIVIDNGNPEAAQKAATMVQERLRKSYQLRRT
jgi:hypothetical protein